MINENYNMTVEILDFSIRMDCEMDSFTKTHDSSYLYLRVKLEKLITFEISKNPLF